jgi:hypothetical protein
MATLDATIWKEEAYRADGSEYLDREGGDRNMENWVGRGKGLV